MFPNQSKAGSLLPIHDWSTPSMLQTADGALQNLVAGKTTPQGFMASVQNDYEQYWKQG
jgi:hypothetical protein